MLKSKAPLNRKQPVCSNVQDSDSEPGNISVARTSTPVKTYTAATRSKTTPNNSRNMVTGFLNDSANQPTKRPKQQSIPSEHTRDRPQHLKYCSRLIRKLSHPPTYSGCRKHSLLCFQFLMVSSKCLKFLRTFSKIVSRCILI